MKRSPKHLLLGTAWLLSLLAAAVGGSFLAPRDSGAGSPPSPSLAEPINSGASSPPLARERSGGVGQADTRSYSPGVTGSDLTDLLRQARGPARTQQLLRILDQLDSAEFPAFVEAFREDPLSTVHQSEYDLILAAWVDRDPYAAAEYLETSDPSGRARETVITAWTEQDPAAAEAWIRDRPDEGPTNNWMVGFARGLAASDTSKALTLIEGLTPGPTQDAGLNALAPFLVAEGPEAAHSWLAELPADGPLLTKATQATARAFARYGPTSAAEWARELPDFATRRHATREIAEVWATSKPSQALQWAGALPPETLGSAAEGIARQLTRTDPETTGDWLDSLGDSAELDRARQTFLGRVQSSHPALALNSVPSLSDPGQQRRYYSSILTRWSRSDQDSATRWVINNADALPRDVVERYTRVLKSR